MNLHRLFDDSRILAIDDRLDQLIWLRDLLLYAGYRQIELVHNPTEALTVFREFHPDLVIVDLHMPQKSGLEVIHELRASMKPMDYLPILVFSSDGHPRSRHEALETGASDYLTKPGDKTEILLRVKNFLDARWMHHDLTRRNEALELSIRERTGELEGSRAEALAQLAKVSEFHDDETGEHTKRVGEISAEIARELGWDRVHVELIRQAAPLHDIGKIGIHQGILRKPGRLTEDEFGQIKNHTRIGGNILEDSRSPVLRLAREIAIFHHERWDGLGYNEGLKGDAIPISARIVTVADVFDALTHDRPYKQAWPEEMAYEEILQQRGKQFDPRVVDAFLGNRMKEAVYMS